MKKFQLHNNFIEITSMPAYSTWFVIDSLLAEIHGGFDVTLPNGQDYDLWLKMTSTNEYKNHPRNFRVT